MNATAPAFATMHRRLFDAYGEPATYASAAGGESVETTAVVEHTREMVDDGYGATVSVAVTRISLPSGVVTPRKGDKVTVGVRQYTIETPEADDGHVVMVIVR